MLSNKGEPTPLESLGTFDSPPVHAQLDTEFYQPSAESGTIAAVEPKSLNLLGEELWKAILPGSWHKGCRIETGPLAPEAEDSLIQIPEKFDRTSDADAHECERYLKKVGFNDAHFTSFPG